MCRAIHFLNMLVEHIVIASEQLHVHPRIPNIFQLNVQLHSRTFVLPCLVDLELSQKHTVVVHDHYLEDGCLGLI